ncbi:GNAT family N-acetyltransferase [Dorea sp. D27]|uniref:GNAT family N-acetyltransferase n=1 Tax=Dorea sp. D27 TaxID=658665 RepID=UPI0006738583|nr:GNAT family N-acetyltransferase [Dorea sp. D27]KMZ53644.1 acetyltransferase, GNAT family [Dorea sp. D27]
MSIMNKIYKYLPHIKRGIIFYLDQGTKVEVDSNLKPRLRIETVTNHMCKDVCAVRNKNVQYAFENMVSKGQVCVFAYVDGRMAGHAACVLPHNIEGAFKVKNSAYIHYCYVDSKYRGNNIYPLMLKYLIETCSTDKDIMKFTITTSFDNRPSQLGLKKVGFSYLKRYYYVEWWKFKWKKITV